MPALGGHLGPGDLETGDPLVGSHPGHTPQEVASDVSLADGERGCQVLWLGQNLGRRWSCAEKKGGPGQRRQEKSACYFTPWWRVIPYGIYIALVKPELTVGSLIMS